MPPWIIRVDVPPLTLLGMRERTAEALAGALTSTSGSLGEAT